MVVRASSPIQYWFMRLRYTRIHRLCRHRVYAIASRCGFRDHHLNNLISRSWLLDHAWSRELALFYWPAIRRHNQAFRFRAIPSCLFSARIMVFLVDSFFYSHRIGSACHILSRDLSKPMIKKAPNYTIQTTPLLANDSACPAMRFAKLY